MKDIEILIKELEWSIFRCVKCSRLAKLRKKSNILVTPGFSYVHYLGRLLIVQSNPNMKQSHWNNTIITRSKNGMPIPVSLDRYHERYDKQIQESKYRISNTGKRISKILSDMGMCWGDVQYTNVVKCSCPKKEGSANFEKPTNTEINKCILYLKKQIKIMPNLKVIWVMGNDAKKCIPKLRFVQDKKIIIVQSWHTNFMRIVENSDIKNGTDRLKKHLDDLKSEIVIALG